MDARQLKDPASGVPQPLLQHLHLVSKNRYPMLPNPSLEAVVSYLLEAPKVMREMQPVQWQFLDAPPDNTMLLVWHPAQHLGDVFATDGYVWTDAETSFDSDVRGYKLQMLWHRAGYKPQVENVAVHSRRRYRLLPNNQMGMASPDPNFWLIHYSKASPRDQQPAASLSMYPQLAAQFQQRRLIQASGQIPRKEFMINDRANWPIIHAPAAVARAAAASGQMGGAHRRAGSVTHEASVEEEEDVSRGDALDFMTPRDISRTRYEQHHEWMEEVLESPYGTKQIVPPEIGLGRKGALESLTDGFFTAPLSSATDPVTGTVGKLDTGKADEFTKRANQKIAEMQAELEKMKERHIKRMEKLKRTTEIAAAEKKLRLISGPTANGQDPYVVAKDEAEQILGKTIEPVSNVQCISKGGTQEMRPPTPPPAPAVPTPIMNTVPLTQPSTENQAQAQQQTQQQPHQSFTTGQQPSPVPAQPTQDQSQPLLDSSASSQNEQAQSTEQLAPPQPDQAGSGLTGESTPAENEPTPNEAGDLLAGADIDVDMSGLDDDQVDMPDNLDASDWDMLNDHSLPDNDMNTESQLEQPTEIEAQKEADPTPENDQPQEVGPTDQPEDPSQSQTEQQLPQPDAEQVETQPPTDDAGTFDMVNDFDNMDSAGDALADYTAGDDLDLNDSAFGDAFHHNEHEES